MFLDLLISTASCLGESNEILEIQLVSDFNPHSAGAIAPVKGDSVVAPVEKANVLAMLDEVTSLEDVHKLAYDEDVQKWQSAKR